MSYNDGLFGSIGYGIEIDHLDGDKNERLTDFAESSLRAIDKRILTCALTYAMLIVTAAAYWLYIKYGSDRSKHLRSIFFAVLTVSAGLPALVLITHAILRMPFYFPAPGDIPVLLVSFPAVFGGSCFLGWMLRIIPFRQILSLAALPLVLWLFMQGTVCEAGLYCAPQVPSFDYIAEEIEPGIYDEGVEGTVYYDQDKDVIVLNGTEYTPRQVSNPDCLEGTGRLSAILFELISPYAGNGLFLIHEAENINAGPAFLSLYAVKALILAVFPFFIKTGGAGSGELI